MKIDFQGTWVTSDGGLIVVRDLDERLGFGEHIEQHLADSRRGKNTQFPFAELLTRPVGRPSKKPLVEYKGFLYRAASWKTARRLVKHARYYSLLLAESHLTGQLFGAILRRIEWLLMPAG